MKRRIVSVLVLFAGVAAGVWIYISRHSDTANTSDDLTVIRVPEQQGSVGSSVIRSARDGDRDRWFARWRNSEAIQPSSDREKIQEDLLEELAAHDPDRAIAVACAELSTEVKTRWLEATLRGWARKQPDAALGWAAHQEHIDHGQAMASVFHGIAKDPDEALQFHQRAIGLYPALKTDLGQYLVAGLARAGLFRAAVEFASQNASAEDRVNELGIAYAAWTEKAPQAATAHAINLAVDSEAQRTALLVAVGRWANRDAGAVANYALTITDAKRRKMALSAALPVWVSHDGEAAAAWLDQFTPSEEFDAGAASIANLPTSLFPLPDVALSWAENIIDARKRVLTLNSVVQKWASLDRKSAVRYVETSPHLTAAERVEIRAGLEGISR